MIRFALSDRLAAGADLETRRALAQSILDDINAEAIRQGQRGAVLESVVLTERPDGGSIVTVEGVAGPRPATMEDFAAARRTGSATGQRTGR